MLLSAISIVLVTNSGAIFQSAVDIGGSTFAADVPVETKPPEAAHYDRIMYQYDSLESDLNIIMGSFSSYLASVPNSGIPNMGTYFTPNMVNSPQNDTNNRLKRTFACGYYDYVNQPDYQGSPSKYIDFKIFLTDNRIQYNYDPDVDCRYSVSMVYIKYRCKDAKGKNIEVQGILTSTGTFISGNHY